MVLSNQIVGFFDISGKVNQSLRFFAERVSKKRKPLRLFPLVRQGHMCQAKLKLGNTCQRCFFENIRVQSDEI